MIAVGHDTVLTRLFAELLGIAEKKFDWRSDAHIGFETLK